MNEKSLRHDVKLKYHSTGLYIESIFQEDHMAVVRHCRVFSSHDTRISII